MRKIVVRITLVCALLFSFAAKSQCFQIESILVDACGGDEGLNEMVRFKVGAAPLNLSLLSVNWPNNSWQGLVQNAITAAKVAELNADIQAMGGCGQILQPTANTLPANATVILVTSFNMDTALNSFGALSQDIYLIFQDNATTTTGHFANFGTGIRTLSMSFGACSDTVSYDRALLPNANGATVVYTPGNAASYQNLGCVAPVPVFEVEAGNGATVCPSATVSVSGSAQGYTSIQWSAPSGTFANDSALSTTYNVPANASGTITLTLTATNSCGQQISDMVTVNINAGVTPNFPTTLSICSGDVVPALATTSPNGISGTWNPTAINNTQNGVYTFTPNANQCASSTTLTVTVTPSTVPNFAPTLSICSGDVVPALATTSPNGISGTWNPTAINNTQNGVYTFTPNANQCASSTTLTVTVTPSTVPNFAPTLSICSGDVVPALATTSPNGISGTWNPTAINNTQNGVYTFTPNANQCASSTTLTVTVTPSTVPNFAPTLSICSGDVVPALATTSPNGISGTWNPTAINNTQNGVYTFTPNANQCASSTTLTVTVTASTVPNFATTLSICNGDVVPALATTSPNGISGTWNPTAINNTQNGVYTFTPNANQCASSTTLTVTVTPSTVPNFAPTLSICSGDVVPALATTSPNGISGTWNPTAINNTQNGVYTFTPNANQCASSTTLTVAVTPSTVPNFAPTLSICSGDVVPALATTSPNGISGTWNPTAINNTQNGVYTFTPNANQCASSTTLTVTVTPSTVPNFAPTLSICSGDVVPALATTSPNGISGTWNPTAINNTQNGVYTFTPNANQCASSTTLTVTVNPATVPVVSFTYDTPICNNSPNLIPQTATGFNAGGVFSSDAALVVDPATGEVNVQASGAGSHIITYFIGAGNCAQSNSDSFTIVILPVTAIAISGPTAVCEANTIQLSASGTGTWSTSNTAIATVNPTGEVTGVAAGVVDVIFTPSGSTCQNPAVAQITVNALPRPILNDAYICVDPQTGTTSSPAFLNTGLPQSGYAFSWTHNGQAILATTPQISVSETGTYQVTATNNATGCSATAQAQVGLSSIAIAEATVATDFSNHQVITVTVTGGSGDYEFQLDNGAPQSGHQFFNVSEGEHTITIRDTNGCNSINLVVYALNYPHYFTPNGDGYNDYWNISGLSYDPLAMIHIFDRYGKLIKSLKPSGSSGWDGTYNGRELPSTDYWFTVSYENSAQKRTIFRAHFALKR